jgi:2-hydroxycyclohexanecarboxyl-CoA dehydrogenase
MSRVAVVTGAASGMGRAIGRRLAESGSRVALLDLDGDGAEAAAAELRDGGATALAAPVDVAAPAAGDDAKA